MHCVRKKNTPLSIRALLQLPLRQRVAVAEVADAIADGRLVEILRDWEDHELPIHLVHHEGRLSAAKTRVFIDFAATLLRAEADRLAAL